MRDKPRFTLDEIFHPRSVAVVGVSERNLATFAAFALLSLIDSGFPNIYPVNPKYKEIFGLPCYPSISAIPGVVDYVIVCIPAERTLDLLDDCARKGVMSVHFFTAGFRESGEKEGAELEQAMLQKARSGGFRIIGPNCTGLFVPEVRLTTVTRMPMEPGHVAFMSQSGGHSLDMPLHAGPRGVRFSKVISYGNALDIDECELLEYFANDPESHIIAAYIEGVRDGKRFRSLLQEAAGKKPVVIYKGGISDAGMRATMSHTASMTSSAKIFEAICRQANAIVVNDIHEMIDILVALSLAKTYPAGRNMAVAGQGGGPSVQASDQMEQVGLHLPPLPADTYRRLTDFLPTAGAILSNPLDATNIVMPDIIYKTMKTLGESPDIDMMLYHMGFHPVTRWGHGLFNNEFFLKPAADALSRAHRETGKPVLLALGEAPDLVGATELFAVQQAFVEAGLPVFHSLEKAGLAMARVEAWYRRQKEMERTS
ncbi:MAG: CoA-binding protein [Syntrophales bacterium]|nr:CoA-binding protein [Syntrophales bacterium]